MSFSTTENRLNPRNYKKVSTDKHSRVISLGLDRSLPKSPTKGQPQHTATKNQKNTGSFFKGKNSYRPGTHRGKYKKSKKVVMGKDGRPHVFGPNNFEKNKALTHNIEPVKKIVRAKVRSRPPRLLSFLPSRTVDCRVHTAGLAFVKPTQPLFRAALTRFLSPQLADKKSKRLLLHSSQLRVANGYAASRRVLMLGSRLRSRQRARAKYARPAR